ncbi:MAG: hypothetical protein KAT68_07715, partial [Bacteroidales bacterium]|nr:hypothetical protein [Bacteroidales bacterium]
MKIFKKLNLRLAILTTFLVIIVTAYGQYSGSVSFDQNQVIFTTQDEYDRIDYPNSFKTLQIGAPELPVFHYHYVIPIDAELTNIIVNDSTQTQLTGTYYVYPAQPPIILDGREQEPFVEPDSLIYNSSEPYPGKLVEIDREYSILGYKVVSLIFYPFEYIPNQQLINLYTNINFTIEYTITSDPVTQPLKISEKRHNTTINHLSNIVKNPDDLQTVRGGALEIVQNYNGTTGLNIPYLPYVGGDMPEYIIITTPDFEDEFKDLAKWKTKKGVPTLVITTDIIYQYYQGCDDAQKIFNYLKDARLRWADGLYVLLGGDEDNIPARITTEMPYYGYYLYYVSDLYYSDVWKDNDDDYDWNWDNDHRFGYGDDEELYLDLGHDNFLGRAPVSNTEQAQEFVEKIISYESEINNDHVNNVMLLAGHLAKNLNGSYAGIGQTKWMNPTYELLPIHIKPNTIRIYEDHNNIN